MSAEHIAEMHNSVIKPSSGDYPDMLKLRVIDDGPRATEVYVTSWLEDGVKLTAPVKGSIEATLRVNAKYSQSCVCRAVCTL